MAQQIFTETEKKHRYLLTTLDGLNITMTHADGRKHILALLPFQESGVWYISERLQEASGLEYNLRLCTVSGDWHYSENPQTEVRFQNQRINDSVISATKYLELYQGLYFLKYDDYIQELKHLKETNTL